MIDVLDSIPDTDPLALPGYKQAIDRIIADNKHLPGVAMVVLNELQNNRLYFHAHAGLCGGNCAFP
jgi:hypothetical protein